MAGEIRKGQGPASDRTHERIDDAADRIKQDADRIAQQTKDTIDGTAARADRKVRAATEAGARGAHRAVDMAADWRERSTVAMDNVRDRAGNLFDDACNCVREKPVETVAITLVAGCLIGWLLRSRR